MRTSQTPKNLVRVSLTQPSGGPSPEYLGLERIGTGGCGDWGLKLGSNGIVG